MTLAEPPIGSFGKLAQLALEHPDWPVHSHPKHRSLSTLFSKLDRKKDVDWLRDRIEVQQVLGQLLKRTVTEIRSSIGEVQYVADDRFLRLSDIRYARELDLTQEELPPGIPRAAYDPPEWGPTWWFATPGSGRSLVGAWLRCRGLAHSSIIRTREDLAKLPSRGPLFLELDSLLKEEDLKFTSEDLSALRASQRPLCIAASFPPPDSLLITLLESAPPADYLPELVDWVADRLDGTGHFHADRAEQWMRRVALPARAVTNFGDALGLLGMIDEVHPRSLSAKSLDELGEHFVERRVREANEASNVNPRLAEDAFPALQECAARVLVNGDNALDAAHPVDEWTSLLSSPQNENVPDPEWFTAALRGALGTQVSRRDLRRAARKLQPGAFQLVRSLEAAGLLVRSGGALSRDEDGALRQLRPRWLVSLLSASAAQEVLRLAPSQWGSVLWVGRDAARICDALHASARLGNFSAPFTLLDDFDAELPESVAALEASVIATGLAALDGYDVPFELVEGLLAHTAENLFVLEHTPWPRLTCDQKGAGFFRTIYWQIALLALSRIAPLPLPQLDPLRTASTPLRAHFEASCEALLAPHSAHGPLSAGRAAGVLACLDELIPRDVADTPATLPRPPPLRLLDNWKEATLPLFEQALRICAFDYIIHFAISQGQSERQVLAGAWRFLGEVQSPEDYFQSSDLCRKAWGCIPAAALRRRVDHGLVVDWSALLPHQFAEWLASSDSHRLPPEAAERCPIDAAISCLEERGTNAFAPATLGVLISRAAPRFAIYLHQMLAHEREEEVAALFACTPREVSAVLIEKLPDVTRLLRLQSSLLNLTRKFLSQAVRERHPGYGTCYQKLLEIEAGVGPLRRLS